MLLLASEKSHPPSGPRTGAMFSRRFSISLGALRTHTKINYVGSGSPASQAGAMAWARRRRDHGPSGAVGVVDELVQDGGGRRPAAERDSSNAVGNFCFEVSLSYRRVELPRRVSAAV